MLDHLKVRAKSKSGSLIFGFYSCKYDEEKNINYPCILIPRYSHHFEIMTFKEILIDESTVQRCTGKSDKDGLDIYEGDIFTLSNDGAKGIVVWSDEFSAFQIKFLGELENRDNRFLGDWITHYRKDEII